MSALLVLAFTTALAMVVLLMPMVMRLATRLGAVSRPGGRHVHGRVTPLLGGLAIAVAFFAGVIVAFPSVLAHASARIPDTKLLVGLAAGAIGMVVLGFVDDTRGMRALKKLGIQAAIAFGVCLCGLQIHSVYVPFVGGVIWFGTRSGGSAGKPEADREQAGGAGPGRELAGHLGGIYDTTWQLSAWSSTRTS